MALFRFRCPPLPVPTREVDAQYQRQFIRVLEIYISQLDSQTPLQANDFLLTDGTSVVEYNERYSLLVG